MVIGAAMIAIAPTNRNALILRFFEYATAPRASISPVFTR